MIDRELERKYISRTKLTLSNTVDTLISVLSRTEDKMNVFGGTDADYFWPPRKKDAKYDFLRLRVSNGQLTLKHTDKGSIQNRLEINADVDSAQTMKILKRVLGEPEMKIVKDFVVISLPGHIEVSAYKVKGNKDIFIEIEAQSTKMINKIEDRLYVSGLALELQKDSLRVLIKRARMKKAGLHKPNRKGNK